MINVVGVTPPSHPLRLMTNECPSNEAATSKFDKLRDTDILLGMLYSLPLLSSVKKLIKRAQ